MVNQIKLTALFGLVALAAVVSLLVGAASLSAADVLHLLVSFPTMTLLSISIVFLHHTGDWCGRRTGTVGFISSRCDSKSTGFSRSYGDKLVLV